MSISQAWQVPKNEALLAAYRINGEALERCDPEQNKDHDDDARHTMWVLQASQTLADAALVVVKSETATSLGVRNGGLIVEGRENLNIGLVRASTRSLTPAGLYFDMEPKVACADRFQRTFWAIVFRLQNTTMPRCFEFFLDGVEGQIHINDGELRFTGDFLTPANFVDELRAACEVGDGIKYRLLADCSQHDGDAYSVADLMVHVAKQTDSDSSKFDANGWPLEYANEHSADKILSMSKMAASSNLMKHHSGPLSILVLSEENRPLMMGKRHADGIIEFQTN